jgi:hypothetical protein
VGTGLGVSVGREALVGGTSVVGRGGVAVKTKGGVADCEEQEMRKVRSRK